MPTGGEKRNARMKSGIEPNHVYIIGIDPIENQGITVHFLDEDCFFRVRFRHETT